MRSLDIAEAARLSGLPASTLRFYEEKGLIRSSGRRGLRRTYAPGVIDQLALITLGRASGFSLEEIAGMFRADGRPRIDRARLAAKAAELDRSIRALTAMRNGLLHAARCPHADHMACPAFRRMMAASRALARRSRRGRPGSRIHPDKFT